MNSFTHTGYTSPSSGERQLAQDVLRRLDWTCIKISKPITKRPLYAEMSRYCETNVGLGRIEPKLAPYQDPDDVWYSFAWYGYWNFFFKHPEHATAFALRWAI